MCINTHPIGQINDRYRSRFNRVVELPSVPH
jgi:hypothetical protein